MPSITYADTAEIETKPQPNDIALKFATSVAIDENLERGLTDEAQANSEGLAVDEFQVRSPRRECELLRFETTEIADTMEPPRSYFAMYPDMYGILSISFACLEKSSMSFEVV